MLSTLAPIPNQVWVSGNGFAGTKGLRGDAHYQNRYVEAARVRIRYDASSSRRLIVTEDGSSSCTRMGPQTAQRSARRSAVYMVTMRLRCLGPTTRTAVDGEDSYSEGEMFRSERITKLDPAAVPRSSSEGQDQ